MATRRGTRVRTGVRVVEGGESRERRDDVATEEPLEIRLDAGDGPRRVAVTMRTPGADFELAAGFLFAEGVIAGREQLRTIRYCTDPDVDDDQLYNVVTVDLEPTAEVDLRPLERHFFTTSACGVCGKASLEQLHVRGCPTLSDGPTVDVDVLYRLPDHLRAAQGVFERTGGLHAAGVFTAAGDVVAVREDVGRHNAVDKVVGWALLEGRLPLDDHVLMVSGRSSFEICQKALTAGIPIVAAVSAPSSLAVDLAQDFGMTLVGFLRGERCNVYAGADRVGTVSPAQV